MRILYFSQDYTTHDRRFLEKIVESSHDVFYLRLVDSADFYEKRPLPKNVRIVEWNSGKISQKGPEHLLRLMPDFSAVLTNIKPDLIHAGPIQSCAFIVAMSGFHPFLAMSWGSDLLFHSEESPLMRWITSFVLNQMDFFLCDCDAVFEKAREYSRVDEERAIKFPWGIELDSFVREAECGRRLRKELGWDGCVLVLSTRSWEDLYGIEAVLKGFAEAHKQNSRLRLLLLGDGSKRQEIDKFIKSRGLIESVYRPGVVPQERLPDFYSASNIYLSCTHSDGASISLLEAMACGLLIIVSDIPGNREWIEREKNGWLVHPSEIDEIAASLISIARFPEEKTEKMVRLNREIIIRRANWDVNVEHLLRLYKSIENEQQ